MPDLRLIAARNSSSGLPEYLEDGFKEAGCQVEFLDPSKLRLPRYMLMLRCFRPSKSIWYRNWRHHSAYTIAAWDRNSKLSTRLVDSSGCLSAPILQIGGLHYPHVGFQNIEYYLFFTYTMRLALRDGISPWVVRGADTEGFLEREALLYQNARKIFVSARFLVDHIVEEYGVDRRRVVVVNMGVDETFVELRPPVWSGFRHRCLFVGYTFELKGGPEAIEGFCRARERFPSLELRVVGPDPEVVPRVAGVRAIGPIADREMLVGEYQKADLFLLPSRCDSFGFVFLEAMSQGCVPVVSNLNAMPEIVGHGRAGLIVPAKDPQAIEHAICSYFSDREWAEELRRRARARILERYRWRLVIEKIGRQMFDSTWPAGVEPVKLATAERTSYHSRHKETIS